ncbi:hypothetical protein D3C72_1081440 [compost metagenome]
MVIGHGFQRQNLVRHFTDGASALFMRDPSVRRQALHAQAQHAGTLACGHAAAAVRACRFGHQAISGVAGEGLNVLARCVAAGFFIGHDQQIDRQRCAARDSCSAQCRQRQIDASLHVVAAWPIQPVAFDADRVIRQHADGMHGIRMAQNQQPLARIAFCAIGDVQQRQRRPGAMLVLRIGFSHCGTQTGSSGLRTHHLHHAGQCSRVA